jgi:hypothetical protein
VLGFVLVSAAPVRGVAQLESAAPMDSAAPGGAALGAGQDPVTDKRPEVAALLAKLDAHVEKKGSEDRDAIAVIDQLLQEFQKSGPKDKAATVKALSKCFEARRTEPEDGIPNNQLFIAAATALGQMGPESTKTLIGWIGHKTLRKDLTVQGVLIGSLGKTRDKEAVKTLLDQLENKDAPLVSASAQALGEFATAELELRKQIFETLLKVLMSAKGAKDMDLNDTTARERYDVISAPIITTLTRLSKHDEREPEKWQQWWNKNKKLDWDEQP